VATAVEIDATEPEGVVFAYAVGAAGGLMVSGLPSSSLCSTPLHDEAWTAYVKLSRKPVGVVMLMS
jgi:hypothetical protein